MELNRAEIHIVIQKFFRVVNLLNTLENTPKDFGTGSLLRYPEVHLIEAVGEGGGLNITQLAKKLGVTKGAISQMAQKIIEKNLIRKVKEADNDKEIILELTPLGMKVFNAHQSFNQEIYQEFGKTLSSEDIQVFEGILEKIEADLTKYIAYFSDMDK